MQWVHCVSALVFSSRAARSAGCFFFSAPAFSVVINFPHGPLTPLLALDCQIIRLLSGPLFSTTYLTPFGQMPLTVALIFRSLLASDVFFFFFAGHLLLLFLPASCLGSKVLFSLLVLQCQVDVHLVRCVQFFLALMSRVRCLGSIWGVEVPGHPVLRSLHSPSTWRRVSFG